MKVVLACAAMAAGAAPAAAQDARPRIAVVHFANNSTWNYWGDSLGKAAADELTTQLVQSGRFSVVERSRLETVLAEQNLGASGRVTPATAAKIGQLLGVQFILTGSITQFSIERTTVGIRGVGGTVSNAESKVDARLIDADTGEILLATEGQGNKRMGGGHFRGAHAERTFDQGAAQEALRPAIESVLKKVTAQSKLLAARVPGPPEGQIVGGKDGTVYINRGQNAGVTVGQRFEVLRVVNEIKDADGRMLDRVMDKVGTIEVTQVMSQSAVCKVIDGSAAPKDAIK